MTQKRVSGTAYLTADGTTLMARGSFEMPLSEYTRTPVLANGEVVGYDEQPNTPYVNAELQVTDETDFATFCASTSQTVKVELANGWKYVLSDAFVQGTPTMNEQGVTSVSFSGKRGQWFK